MNIAADFPSSPGSSFHACANTAFGPPCPLLDQPVRNFGSVDALWAAQLPDLRGVPVKLADLRGKPLIVNFWATWCGPCKEEMPDFQRLAAGDLGKRVQIVGIGIDNLENMRSFGEKLGITYPLLEGGSDALDMLKALGNSSGGLPYTIVLDGAGKQVSAHLGRMSYEELKTQATAALKR